MQWNSLLFPAPECSYGEGSRNIIWIQSDPKNTPVFHFQRISEEIKKKEEKNNENKEQRSNPFSSCINFSEDKSADKSPHNIKKSDKENNQSQRLYDTLSVQKEEHSHFKINSEKQIHSNNKEHNILLALKKAAEFGPELNKVLKTKVPCMYLPYYEGSNKLIIFFHGNAEDLGYSYDFASCIMKELQVNVLVVEYPGYGLYKGEPNSDQILSDADSVYEHALSNLKFSSENIIIFGRSIGSGPACYLAGTRNNGGLILMSAYTSIKNVVKHLAGIFHYIVAERFRNIDLIKNSKQPTLFIHGKKDTLIPYQHSIELMECIKDRAMSHIPEDMTHNIFDLFDDFINPIKQFFKKFKIVVSKSQIHNGRQLIQKNH